MAAIENTDLRIPCPNPVEEKMPIDVNKEVHRRQN